MDSPSEIVPTLVIVTGSRWFTNPSPVRAILRRYEKFELFEGRCPYGGVDDIAKNFAESKGMIVHPFPPDFAKYQPGAAFAIRNRAMVDTALKLAAERRWPIRCHAFFIRMLACKGTKQCSEYAEKRGVPVERHAFSEQEARPRQTA